MSINNFKERTSVRYYTDEKLTEEQMKDLVKAINNSPTANNSQQFSAIIIEDKEGLEILGDANGGSPWVKTATGAILFVGDTTRNEHLVPLEPNSDREGTKDRLLVDAIIATTYTQDALMSMGFGSTFIGGLTIKPGLVHDYFDLPETSFIAMGLAFGKAEKVNAFKPKTNKVFFGKYDKKQAFSDIEKYNDEMREYYKQRGSERDFAKQLAPSSPTSWSGREHAATAAYYKEIDKRYKK